MSPRTQAVLIGGAFTGVLSALPIVNLANCCCLWLVGGGAVAAYLLQQSRPQPLEVADGAIVGCLAGIFGAVVHSLVSIPMLLVTGPIQQRMAEALRGNAELPPEVAQLLDQVGASPIAMLFGFFFMLLLGAVFSTLGGVLGAVVFGRRREGQPVSPA